MSTRDALPFEDSRRLTGPNLFFGEVGAVLEVVGGTPDDVLLAAWRARALRARQRLRWRERAECARCHAGGASLAISAPPDQLMVATEINEWAWCAALFARDPVRWATLESALRADHLEQMGAEREPPVLEETQALARFERLARAEAEPALIALLAAAHAHALPTLLDDEQLTLGAGRFARTFARASLPAPDTVPWEALHGVPTALVSGSNGKTTAVRAIAACLAAAGRCVGYNCTDGVFIGESARAAGDYSGPAGARLVLRDPQVDTAVLESARGGILRRGLAYGAADAALVTNVSVDHFGEYGIYDLAGLADAKLTLAHALKPGGRLVLNAEDAVLVGKALPAGASALSGRLGRAPALAWFALEADAPLLRERRAAGEATCGVRAGRLVLEEPGRARVDLGAVEHMPLTVSGLARHNIANLAAAALVASALGAPAEAIARTCAQFGARARDNPGRLMRFAWHGAQVLLDYAHNVEGLQALLAVAQALRGAGRLAVLLGHAGNRQDADYRDVAAVVAHAHPDLVIVKENEQHLRGRQPGEVPRLLQAALRVHGLSDTAVRLESSELAAARAALGWARAGDVLVMPVHAASARAAVLDLLDPPTDPPLVERSSSCA